MNATFLSIISFYVILIGLLMAFGSLVAIKTAFVDEQTGFILGMLAGVAASYYLWLNYGSKMVPRNGMAA